MRKTSLLSPEVSNPLWKISVLKGRLEGRKAESSKARVDIETLHDTMENSIHGNPIDENTL